MRKFNLADSHTERLSNGKIRSSYYSRVMRQFDLADVHTMRLDCQFVNPISARFRYATWNIRSRVTRSSLWVFFGHPKFGTRIPVQEQFHSIAFFLIREERLYLQASYEQRALRLNISRKHEAWGKIHINNNIINDQQNILIVTIYRTGISIRHQYTKSSLYFFRTWDSKISYTIGLYHWLEIFFQAIVKRLD